MNMRPIQRDGQKPVKFKPKPSGKQERFVKNNGYKPRIKSPP